MGRKLGVDFSRSGKLSFLDGLGVKFGKGVRDVEKEIINAVQRLKINEKQRVLVILDGVDFLAAAMGAEVTEVMDMVTEIREVRFLSLFPSSEQIIKQEIRRNITGEHDTLTRKSWVNSMPTQ